MKQSTKRIFAAALAALVVAAVGTTLTTQLPQLTNSVAYAATIVANGTCGAPYVNDGKNVTWELTDDGTLTISGTGAMRNYVNAGNDTADTPWKDYKNDIKKIVIGKEITSIGTYNFALLPNLENITFEENSQLKIIGRHAFYNSGFTNITIPASVTTIDVGAFVACSSLTKVTFAKNSKLERIGTTAFSVCSGLTSITLPSSVISIENRAFISCANLTTVTMESANPPTLEELIFLNTSLNTISVPVDALNKYKNACDKGEKGWKAEYKNMLAVGGDCGAEGHESEVTWKLQNGTLTISGSGAMEGYIISSSGTDAPWKNYRDSIKEVVIDSGITYIASGSFADCTNLIEVTFAENSTLQEIDDSAFARCTGLTSVTIPKSVASIGDGVFSKNPYISILDFSDNAGLTSFSANAGIYLKEQEDVIKGVTEKVSKPFYLHCVNVDNCPSLTWQVPATWCCIENFKMENKEDLLLPRRNVIVYNRNSSGVTRAVCPVDGCKATYELPKDFDEYLESLKKKSDE